MVEEKPVVLKILLGCSSKGYRWIDRTKRSSNPYLQKYYADHEWKEFCDNVDSSLNLVEETEPVEEIGEWEESSPGITCMCLYWAFLILSCGIGFCVMGCLALCAATEHSGGDNTIIQPVQMKACMKLLNEESKKKGNILLQMEKTSGTIAASRDAESGAYVQHIKCTIKEDKFIDDVL
ncbi:predicted protein [Chaetoceros tenuissimus]|uniref:Uncharacterized protein n=1 Tax=Chaetoceros tenuissimus TaxID=426638 RepID=A0AAD3D044_9STRA|nr:predicted protein [Chaetoceros tenuissimus]